VNRSTQPEAPHRGAASSDHLLTALNGQRRDDFFRALVESSQDSIKILDLDGKLLSMNRSGQDLMELDADQRWLHKNWLDLWPASHRDSVSEALERAREGTSGRFEAYRPTAKGRPTWWDVVVSPIQDETGSPVNILAIARDITDRKRAADSVRFVAEASFIVTESLEYQQTISNVARVLVPDLADWCAVDLVGDDRAIEPGTIVHGDPDKLELARTMRRRYPPTADATGGSGFVLRTGNSLVVSSISDEMLAKATRSEEHFEMARALGLHSYAAVPLKARGHTVGALVLVSSEGDRTYTDADLPLLEELGRICGLAVDNARLYRSANKELAERRNVEAKLLKLNATLERRVAQRTAELREANQELTEEVRERQRAETRLHEANRQLRSRNRELEEFADAASHDLKEPLRKISSFADLIETEFRDQLPEAVHRYLDRIQHASIRTSELIRDLLSYSRVEAEADAKSTVDLNRIVREVLIDLEVPIAESNAHLEVGELPAVRGHQTQLRQLFQNLIGNALKFHRPDSAPHVRISAELTSGEGEPPLWCLTVSDNGIGFDRQYAERIFVPFQRLHEKGTFPGTGMGLAICRRIVERHHGEITAESAEGEGATFRFTIAGDGPEA